MVSNEFRAGIARLEKLSEADATDHEEYTPFSAAILAAGIEHTDQIMAELERATQQRARLDAAVVRRQR